jgi:hypothetical protein
VIASVSGAVLGWLALIQIWILVLWYRPGRNSFPRRLDQLLAVLLAGSGRLGQVNRSARRWRKQLRPIYAQGYAAAAATISPGDRVARGQDLVQDTLVALKAERAVGGAKVPATEDPVVVFAYGLGAWPPRADLTSLERLLSEIGVSQPALRSRFDSLFRLVTASHQTREFRELAGASFVLGAAARILEAATAADGTVPPRGFLATLKAHLR